MDDADGVGGRVIGPEGVRADEFGQAFRLVRLSGAYGTHFVENHRDAPTGNLPGGFRTGEASANDVDGIDLFVCHERGLARFGATDKVGVDHDAWRKAAGGELK